VAQLVSLNHYPAYKLKRSPHDLGPGSVLTTLPARLPFVLLPSLPSFLAHQAPSSIVVDGGAEVNCEEKTRLATEYKAAMSGFSEAVKEMRRRIVTSPKGEYKWLEQTANEAHAKSEQARLALEQHISTHRC
jgi:hypothetical protein